MDWPLNLVVTESCLGRYSGIFSFLLQLKLMVWALKDVCFHLKRTGAAAVGKLVHAGPPARPARAHPRAHPRARPQHC